jgi:hypothetical protein
MPARKPIAQALTAGRNLKDPARYRGRKSPDRRPIGDPPAKMSAAEREAWRSFASELPWLARPHRAILHLACRLCVRIESGAETGPTAMSVYSAILSKLGASPVDEGRVFLADEPDEDDETARFFN